MNFTNFSLYIAFKNPKHNDHVYFGLNCFFEILLEILIEVVIEVLFEIF